MSEQPAVKLSDLEDALLFVGGGGGFNNAAWLCRATGKVVCHSDEVDDDEPLPDDIDDEECYVPIPNRHDFGLGKPLALDFAREHLPDCFDEVRAIFSHRGAYGRFKDLLDRRGRLEAWYEYEHDKTLQALRDWCEENGITVAD